MVLPLLTSHWEGEAEESNRQKQVDKPIWQLRQTEWESTPNEKVDVKEKNTHISELHGAWFISHAFRSIMD